MQRLKKMLQQIDGRGYKAYKEIQGDYQGDWFRLHIDHVQGDPFAAPSRIRIGIPQDKAKLRPEWYGTKERKIALEDFLAREAARVLEHYGRQASGSGKSGLVAIDAPGQEILQRTAVLVSEEKVEIRLSVGLPAAGRRILGKQAAEMLCEHIPRMIEKAVLQRDESRLIAHLQLADQQAAIRSYLQENGFVAFIANGAILPRESGVSNRPLRGERVIPFQSPPSLEVEISVPHREPVRGMGIPRGVTLIVGGGYHGKTTLLKAIERGVYNHVLGDGREFVITDETAVKIRAEDGRRVEKVNISPFINQLPFGQGTRQFSSDDASGSTSQAANIIEALEVGTRLLLIDEDTSATNFMIRDARMQQLVSRGKEPITPFIDKVRQLFEEKGVSTILVVGGSGDYFDVADRVVMMDEYRPYDVTERAKEIARRLENRRMDEGGSEFGAITPRILLRSTFNAQRGRKEKVDAKGMYKIVYGRTEVELRFVEQLVDPSQTRAIADMMRYIEKKMGAREASIKDWLEEIYSLIEQKGLDAISPFYGQHPGDLALPRPHELAAAINRLRTLRVK